MMKISIRPIIKLVPSANITIRAKQGESRSADVFISSGIDKPLKIFHLKDSLSDGRVKYSIETVEEGKQYKIHFENNPDMPGDKKGELRLGTNYKEKPEIRIRIWSRISPNR